MLMGRAHRNCHTAQPVVQREESALVVLDVGLRGEDGISLARRLSARIIRVSLARDWLSEATSYREADPFDRAIELR